MSMDGLLEARVIAAQDEEKYVTAQHEAAVARRGASSRRWDAARKAVDEAEHALGLARAELTIASSAHNCNCIIANWFSEQLPKLGK